MFLHLQNTNIEKRTLSVLGIKSFFFYFVSMQLSLQAHCLILSLPSTICHFTRAVRWSPSTSIRIVSPSLTSSARISFAESVSTCFCKNALTVLHRKPDRIRCPTIYCFCRICQLYCDLTVRETFVEICDQKVDDVADIAFCEWLEHDDLIKSV